MGIPSDEVVQIRHTDVADEPTVVTISCSNKTGFGCDLCQVVLLFGLNIVKGGNFYTQRAEEKKLTINFSVLGDPLMSCEIDSATEDMSCCLQASTSLPPSVMEQMFNIDLIEEQSCRSRSDSSLSVTMDNSQPSTHAYSDPVWWPQGPPI